MTVQTVPTSLFAPRRHRTARHAVAPLAGLALLLLLSGCDQPSAGATPTPAAPAPVAVTVLTLQSVAVPVISTLPGRTAPFSVAEIRPQVGGLLQERLFTEGERVTAGQPLFRIAAAPFEAAVQRAEAAVARAEATVRVTTSTATRFRTLARAEAVTAQNLENAEAAMAQAQADVMSSRAALDTARIDLSYTRVTSPVAGRTGRANVTVGALVTASQAAPLVTVTQLDPIFVDLTQPSASLLQARRDISSGALRRASADRAVVRLLLEDGSQYPLAGEVQFSEVIVDQGTGSVTLRARFPNPDQLLLPGMFVRALVEEGITDRALLVPQRAVLRTPRGEPMAFVVNAQGVVEQRILRASRTIGTNWLVTDGLNPGDRVVMEGFQRFRAGARVNATERTVTAAGG